MNSKHLLPLSDTLVCSSCEFLFSKNGTTISTAVLTWVTIIVLFPGSLTSPSYSSLNYVSNHFAIAILKMSHLCFKFTRAHQWSQPFLSIPNLHFPFLSVSTILNTSTPKTVPVLSTFMPFHKVNYTYLLSLILLTSFYWFFSI